MLPETSDRGPVLKLGVSPDHMVQLNFALPVLSFSQPQKVESSKSQSKPWREREREREAKKDESETQTFTD